MMITQFYISVAVGFYLLLTIRIFGIRGNPLFWWLSYGKDSEEIAQRAVRGHGNFIEYTPLFFIMFFLLEYMGTPEITLHTVAIIFLIGRFSHGLLFSFLTFKSFALRAIGMTGTLLGLFLAAFMNFIHYMVSFHWPIFIKVLNFFP